MVKINKKQYENEDKVRQILIAEQSLTWNKAEKFKWAVTIEGKSINVKKNFIPYLLMATNNHCAFCDVYPLDIIGENQIPLEHFEPKSRAENKAYSWSNLFPVCYPCTDSKKDQFNEMLLKPDDDDYEFEKYFFVTGDGHLECLMNDKNSKASVTINTYKLNRSYLVKERKKHIRDYPKLKITNPNEYPFRYLINPTRKYKDPSDIINKYLA